VKSEVPATSAVRKSETELRDFAMAYPETREDFPWGHRAIKVKGKTFVFLCADGNGLSLSVKLAASHAAALDRPFAEPTHYGLGKSGWVTATFAPSEKPPLELLRAWIDESFRAIAPKKLAASASQRSTAPAPASARKPARKRAAAKLRRPAAKAGAVRVSRSAASRRRAK